MIAERISAMIRHKGDLQAAAKLTFLHDMSLRLPVQIL